jgi:CelD/BcsL family acetyltransferase involved in cellulose biosynthesis
VQRDWLARGKPGAFADAFMVAFHRELLARAVPRREALLARLSASGRELAYLYNFRLAGRVLAYQRGIARDAAGRHGKPGLMAHVRAIEHAAQEAAESYDFLAGGSRYKQSLANVSRDLHWAELVHPYSLRAVLARLRHVCGHA